MAKFHLEAVHPVPEAPLRLEMKEADPGPTRWLRTGVVLMAVSLVLWVPLPLIVFLPLSVETRATTGGVMLLGAEVTFWLGAVLAGPEALKRCRAWLGLRRASRRE